MSKMKTLDWVAIALLVVGGLNWGLVGAFGFNLVTYISSSLALAWLEKAIYIAVGLSSIYSVFSLSK